MSPETADRVEYFGGPFRYLSNFYEVPVEFEGAVYPTSEHAFQAAKTIDPDDRELIRKQMKAKDAKRAGRNLHGIRPDWDDVKIGVMEQVVLAKFQQHQDLREKLLATGDAELVEGNSWGDRFWGVTADGVGENHLGKILMRVRDHLKQT